MAFDTTDLLGRKQSAGLVVMPRGWSMQHGIDGHGLAGMAIGATVRKLAKEDTSQTPQFGKSAYLAVTDTEVAVLKVKRGAPGGLGEVIARVPRDRGHFCETRRRIACEPYAREYPNYQLTSRDLVALALPQGKD